MTNLLLIPRLTQASAPIEVIDLTGDSDDESPSPAPCPRPSAAPQHTTSKPDAAASVSGAPASAPPAAAQHTTSTPAVAASASGARASTPPAAAQHTASKPATAACASGAPASAPPALKPGCSYVNKLFFHLVSLVPTKGKNKTKTKKDEIKMTDMLFIEEDFDVHRNSFKARIVVLNTVSGFKGQHVMEWSSTASGEKDRKRLARQEAAHLALDALIKSGARPHDPDFCQREPSVDHVDTAQESGTVSGVAAACL